MLDEQLEDKFRRKTQVAQSTGRAKEPEDEYRRKLLSRENLTNSPVQGCSKARSLLLPSSGEEPKTRRMSWPESWSNKAMGRIGCGSKGALAGCAAKQWLHRRVGGTVHSQ